MKLNKFKDIEGTNIKMLDITSYGSIIVNKDEAEEIYKLIDKQVKQHKQISVDLSKILTMTTSCAKQIFGQLYVELGAADFYERITIKGASQDLKIVIRSGIESALEQNKNKSN